MSWKIRKAPKLHRRGYQGSARENIRKGTVRQRKDGQFEEKIFKNKRENRD